LPAVVIATEITAFHVMGALLALWAVLLAGLGIMRHNFPGSDAAEKAVMAISAILVAAAIGTGIATSESPAKGESGEQSGAKNKAGEEGSSAPDQGGTQAPDTAPEGGQEEAGSTGQNAPAGKSGQTLKLNADPNNGTTFNTDQLTATAGHVRITMTNPADIEHNVSLEGSGVSEQGETVGHGGASEVEADLKAGTYTYFCSVPGHREQGMEGTLTVK
jgi:plastocyanin